MEGRSRALEPTTVLFYTFDKGISCFIVFLVTPVFYADSNSSRTDFGADLSCGEWCCVKCELRDETNHSVITPVREEEGEVYAEEGMNGLVVVL